MRISDLPDLPADAQNVSVPAVADGTTYKALIASLVGNSSAATGIGVDSPPLSADARNDEFTGTELSSGWTWINQGAATATVSSGRVLLFRGNTGGSNNLGLLHKPVTESEFSITAKLKHFSTLTNPTASGIFIGNPQGAIIIFVVGYPSFTRKIEINRLSSPFNYVNTIANPSVFSISPLTRTISYYAQIKLTSGVLRFSVSLDGRDFDSEIIAQEQLSNFLGQIDKAGFVLQSVNGDSWLSCEWFRFNWKAGD